MEFIPVRTRRILPPQDDIFSVLDESLPRLRGSDIVFIASKVLAIHQGRTVKIGEQIDKNALIKSEAESFVPSKHPYGDFLLTIKGSTLIPSSGIDESNGKGYYILWPKHPEKLAREICEYLKKKNRIKKLAVVVTDSHTMPLRAGTIGISIGYFGLEPLREYRGTPDIFGRKLKHTRLNMADSLAAMAVMTMGEGKERTPIVIARGVEGVKFTDIPTWRKMAINLKQDLYYPLLKVFKKP